MKKIISVLFLILVLTACSTKSMENFSLPPQLFQEQFAATQDAILLDVRTPEEVQAEYLKGALNFDFKSPQFKLLIEGLDRGKPYFVYCASGIRSGKAAELMREADFKHVYTMEGGLKAWKQAGLSTDIPSAH